MTKSLSCRDIERLMIEGEDRPFSAGERSLLDEHLRGCVGCRGFAADRALVRGEFAGIRWPAPSDELVMKTRRMLRERGTTPPAALPVWVIVALAAVTITTSLWLAAWLPDITPGVTLADLPFGAWAAVFIIVQNALILFCAPVVLRTARLRRDEPDRAR